MWYLYFRDQKVMILGTGSSFFLYFLISIWTVVLAVFQFCSNVRG